MADDVDDDMTMRMTPTPMAMLLPRPSREDDDVSPEFEPLESPCYYSQEAAEEGQESGEGGGWARRWRRLASGGEEGYSPHSPESDRSRH